MDIALFSPSSLFGDEEGGGKEGEEEDASPMQQTYLERSHVFPGGMEILIREYTFHQLNANLLWPGTFSFCEWFLQHHSCLKERRILELGSGTGALSIFLRKSFGVDITTSDFDDREIEDNIAYNCRCNGLEVLPHVRYTWGETFPVVQPDWDMIIASDILLYVKQYPNLIKSLCFLLKAYKPRNTPKSGEEHFPDGSNDMITGTDIIVQKPMFLMSWRRRIGRDDEDLFFKGCKENGLVVEHLGSRVYNIHLMEGNQA